MKLFLFLGIITTNVPEVFLLRKEITEELCSLSEEERLKIINRHRKSGVKIPLSDGIFIGKDVSIEENTIILPGSILTGETVIEGFCHIGPNTVLYNVTVKKEASLNNVQAYESVIGEKADIGPYVHIRPGSNIAKSVHLGNFVEVKNSNIDEGTKVSHLTYIGDSDIGKNVNFGCGCVTVNYTGKEKFRTTVGDNCFIGCNTNLIAPVKIGDYGYTAAGSTITDDVPENALGIARARQTNKENWVKIKKPYKNTD